MNPIRRIAPIALASLLPAAAPGQGFPNVPRTAGELIAGPIEPNMGRAAIVAWHDERIVVVPEGPGSIIPPHDVRMRIIDINDPANPQSISSVFVGGSIHAHAYFHSGSHLFVGGHCASANGLSPCSGAPGDFFADSLRIGGAGTPLGTSTLRRTTMADDIGLYIGTYDRMATQAPWGANDYWTYNALDAMSFFSIRRGAADFVYGPGEVPNGPGVRATWNHRAQTGVNGFAFLMGNILIYASDMSGTGVATYDVSDPESPVLLDVLKEENPGGYWPEIYGHYIFFPRRDAEGGVGSSAGFMIVDFADPSNLAVVHDADLPGSNQYVTFQDEFAFMNHYKIDMRTFEPVLTLQTIDATGVYGLDASQFALPVGNLVVTGGYGSTGPGIAIWAHQDAPDTRGPWVAYHVPRPDQTNYSLECPITLSIPETLRTETIVNGTTLAVRPIGPGGIPGAPIPIWHSFSQGKLLTVTSQQPLQPDTTYEVSLTAGILDAAGNAMEPYSFRFSTGDGLSGGNTPPTVASAAVAPEIAAPGVLRTFTWSGNDAEGGSLDYRIDFGDGTPRTDWSGDTSAMHTYAEAGHYNVLVQVRDAQGALGAYSRGVTVAAAPSQPNSTASSTLALASGTLFVANSDAHTVSAVDAASLAKLWEVPTAAHPAGVATAADGTVWAVCRDADAIDVLSAADGSLVERITLPYGTRPVAIAAVNASPTMLVSAEGPGRLLRFSTATRTQSGSVALGPMPRAIAVNQAGTRALVTRFISAENSGAVYDVDLGGAMSLTRTIGLRRDTAPDGSASSRGVPNYLSGIRIDPNGTHAWVVGKKDNTTRGSFYSASQPLGPDSTVRAQLMLINLATNAEDYGRRLDIDNSDSPSAVAFSPLGDYAYVALQGNAQVAVIDTFDFADPASPGTVIARWETGTAPQGLASDPGTGRLFAGNLMDRTVTALDAAAYYTGASSIVPDTTVGTVAAERLHPEVLRGKKLFYHASDTRMSAEGYISCATCHIDGSHDGRTFDFTSRGEGFRNTTDLRGRSGTFHGNVHWTNNFDEIQDFENDIRNAFGGSGFLSDGDFAATSAPLGSPKTGLNDELDALAAYVTSLGPSMLPRSPHRNGDGSLSAAALAGQALFAANNCASCHTPSADYTDRLAHNVGTLRASSGQRLGATLSAIDTPTLLGVHATAPYFHDGSAATLADVFTTAGGRLAQAESGTRGGGATLGDEAWMTMKDWQQGNFIAFQGAGTLSFADVNSTAGGSGFVEIRHSNNAAANITVAVNGVPTVVLLPATQNLPNWMYNSWRATRAAVPYQAGVNAVAISATNLAIDSILFTTPGDLAAAAAHVRGFTPQEIADLSAYLNSLDATDAAIPAIAIARTGTILPGATDAAVAADGQPFTDFAYTVTNGGTGPLNLGSLSIDAAPAGAASLQGGCAPTLLPGASTQVVVRVAGAATVALSLPCDAPGMAAFAWTLAVSPSASVGHDWWLLH